MSESISAIRISGATSPSPDYTSLSSWVAAEVDGYDCVTNTTSPVAECYNDWTGDGLADQVTVNPSAANATHKPIIRAATGEGHDGTPGTGFRLCNNAHNIDTLTVSSGGCYLEDIEVRVSSSYTLAYSTLKHTGGILSVDRCIFKGWTYNNRGNVVLDAENQSVDFRNFLTLGGAISLSIIRTSGTELLVRNGVIANAVSYGLQKDNYTTPVVKNVVILNSGTTDFYVVGGSWGSGSDYNASEDTTAETQFGSTNSINGIASSDFVDTASSDYHIDTDSTLYQAGTDLSGSFTTDMDGDTWGSIWSIGFDEPAAGGGVPTLSSPSVTNVLSDRVTPQVTLTF